MIVAVDGRSAAVTLDDAENLQGLSVELRSCTPAEAARLLTELGRIDGEHVWLDIARLRALSPLSDDPEWVADFEKVMAYAAGKGWIDDTGSCVRAHLTEAG